MIRKLCSKYNYQIYLWEGLSKRTSNYLSAREKRLKIYGKPPITVKAQKFTKQLVVCFIDNWWFNKIIKK